MSTTTATPMPKMAKITLVDNGMITAYEADETRGYFQLTSTKVTTRSGIFGTTVIRDKRNCLVDGEIENLKEMLADMRQYGIHGKIVNREFKYSELPEEFKAGVKKLDKYLKIAGDSGIVCQKDGEDIYRISFYDESGEEEDVLIQHDNGELISKAGKAVRDAAASSSAKTKVKEEAANL